MNTTVKCPGWGLRRPAPILVLAAVLLSGCGRGVRDELPQRSGSTTASSVRLAVVDTASWECGGNGGTLGVLFVDGSYTDTVDLSFGIHAVTGGHFFAPMETVEEPFVGFMRCPLDPVFFDGNDRTALAELLPLFRPGLSNPTSLSDTVLYWGFQGNRIYAVRFALTRGQADTTFLTDDPAELQHGNRYHFDPPLLLDGEIVFSTWSGRVFVLDEDLAVIRDSVPGG